MAGHVSARRWANRLNLSTPLGLALARMGGARTSGWSDGLTVATGYRLAFPSARAFTVGNVVLTPATLDQLREFDAANPGLMQHEARYASQYALCLGPLMLPMYAAACAWSWLLTGDWWSRNPFETRAGLSDGGYTSAPAGRASRGRDGHREPPER